MGEHSRHQRYETKPDRSNERPVYAGLLFQIEPTKPYHPLCVQYCWAVVPLRKAMGAESTHDGHCALQLLVAVA